MPQEPAQKEKTTKPTPQRKAQAQMSNPEIKRSDSTRRNPRRGVAASRAEIDKLYIR